MFQTFIQPLTIPLVTIPAQRNNICFLNPSRQEWWQRCPGGNREHSWKIVRMNLERHSKHYLMLSSISLLLTKVKTDSTFYWIIALPEKWYEYYSQTLKKVKPLEIVKGKEGRWSRPKQSTRTDRKKRKSMRFGQRRLKFRTFSNSTLVEVSCQSVLRRKNSPAQGSDGTENGKESGGCGRD